MKIPQLLAEAFSQAASALIRLDPDSAHTLKKLAGKVICLHIDGLDLRLYLFLHADEIEVSGDFDGVVDTTIQGSPADLLSMRNSNRGLFRGEVQMHGDVETGKSFSRFLNRMDIDWEEHVASLLGDIAAYRLGRVFRGVRDTLTASVRTSHQNAGEYIAEESGLGTSGSEVEGLILDIDRFREALDRLDARVALLEMANKENAP